MLGSPIESRRADAAAARLLLLLAGAGVRRPRGVAGVAQRGGEVEARVGPLVPVVVATRDLPAGRRIGRPPGACSWRQVPERFAPPDALGRSRPRPPARTAVPLAAGGYVTAAAARRRRGPRPRAACCARRARARGARGGRRGLAAPARARAWTCSSRREPAPAAAAPSSRSRTWSCSAWAARREAADSTGSDEAGRSRGHRAGHAARHAPPGRLPHGGPELRPRGAPAGAPAGRPPAAAARGAVVAGDL